MIRDWNTTRAWKVYGLPGHRQGESFCKSYKYDFASPEEGTRILEVLNSDLTGTNDYSLVVITRNTWKECMDELSGQLSDGIFENSRTGLVEEIDLDSHLFEILDNGLFGVAVEMMDEDICEAVSWDLFPCSGLEYLNECLKRYREKHGEGFCEDERGHMVW